MSPMSPPRRSDWAERLDRFLAARRAQPFAWGVQDCCLFVADAVREIHAIDPAEGLRGYRSERGAARILRRLGGIEGVAASCFGGACPPALAQVGDVVLVHTGGRDSLALCAGAHWLAPGPSGLVAGPMSEARAAWRGA